MTKSAMFTAAHKIAKQTVATVGNYMIAFSLALKSLYRESVVSIKEKIISMGGNEWIKNDMDRVYFNCDILNKLRSEKDMSEVNLSEKNNKFFFDNTANAVMRSYKGKKPTVEIQY